MYMPPRELERKFEIVLSTENARVELKSSAKESSGVDLLSAPNSVVTRAVLRKLRRSEDFFHVARRELERNFETVNLAESSRMELKSNA
jgi:hypothetical protein